MGRTLSAAATDETNPGALADFNKDVLLELWLLLACKHGCPLGLSSQPATLFEKMREARLGWRAFWDAFPYELREQGNALDDDSVDALGVLLQSSANRRRFERHFARCEEDASRRGAAAAALQPSTATTSATNHAASSLQPPAPAARGAPAPFAQRRYLHARRTGGGAAAGAPSVPPSAEGVVQGSGGGGRGGSQPPLDLLRQGASPVELFAWLCDNRTTATDAVAVSGVNEGQQVQQQHQQQGGEDQKHQGQEGQQQQQQEADEKVAEQRESTLVGPVLENEDTSMDCGEGSGSGASSSDDDDDDDDEGGSDDGDGTGGARRSRASVPAPFAAVHKALTSEDQSMLEAVLSVVPYNPPLRDMAASLSELSSVAQRHPCPSTVVSSVATGVEGMASCLVLLQASSGMCLQSVAAEVALQIAGYSLKRLSHTQQQQQQQGGEGAAQPHPQPANASQQHGDLMQTQLSGKAGETPHSPSGPQPPAATGAAAAVTSGPAAAAAASAAAAHPPPAPLPSHPSPSRLVYLADMSGLWEASDLEEKLAGSILRGGVQEAADMAELLSGHLKLLGTCLRRPVVLLLANCDAALAYEAGAELFELVRRVLALLPRSTVVLSCSADTAQFVRDCTDVLLVAGGGPDASSHLLPDGATLQVQLMRVRPAGPRYGLPWSHAVF